MKVLSQKIITPTHTCTKHINMMKSRGSIEKQVNTRKTIQSYKGRRHLRTCEKYLEEELRTTGFSCSWRKMEAAMQESDGWRRWVYSV